MVLSGRINVVAFFWGNFLFRIIKLRHVKIKLEVLNTLELAEVELAWRFVVTVNASFPDEVEILFEIMLF